MKHQSFSSRKSAQKQFVLLLTLTLCLILILNLLLYNHRAQQLYTEQLKKDNYNTALQISREFDASMDLMRTACWNMVHNNREFIRIVETYDNSFEHKTALMSYLSSMLPVNEYFDSVYLYLPNYQTVLSTAMGAMPFDRFFDPVPINDMLSQDKRTSLRTLYSRSTPHVLGGQNISSIVMKVPSSDGYSQSCLVVNINFSRVVSEELVRKYCVSGSEQLSMFDSQGTCIWGEGTLPSSGESTVILDQTVVTKLISENTGLLYLFETPAPSVLFAGLDIYYILFVATLFLAALAIILYAFLRLFRPLRRILSSIISSEPAQTGEFEALDNYIGRMKIENQTMRVHLKEALPIYRNHLLTEIITLPDWSLDEMLEKLRYQDIYLKLENYIVMTLKPAVNQYTEEEKWQVKLKTLSVLSQLFSESASGFYAETEKDAISTALHLPGDEEEETKIGAAAEFAENLCRGIRQQTNVQTNIGIGRFVTKIQLLYKSYADSVTALNFVTTFDSPVINIYQIQKNVGSAFEYPYEKERRFTHFVSLGLYEESLEALHAIFVELKQYRHLKKQEITFVFFQLLSSLYGVIYENKLDIGDFPISKMPAPYMDGIYDLDKIEAEITDMVCKIISSVERLSCTSDDPEIIAYINDHFTENLQMVDLTEHFNYNRFYISQIIKERTGYNFNDYVNRKKVELSKKLLSETDLSIKDIAEQTGFSYSYYFSKIFKKYEDMTPGEYREAEKKSGI